MSFITKILLNALALFLLAEYLPGFSIDKVSTAIIAALVFGLLNVSLKPILLILTLPINVLTLGLFTLVINGSLLLLVSKLLDGFAIKGLLTAILASLVLSVVSYLAGKK